MRDKRICITKQATFIGLICMLLLGYVFFAIRTMTNKTSTDSRASNTNKKVAMLLPTAVPPLCPLDCIYLNPAIMNDGTVQFTATPRLSLKKGSTYAVFKYDKQADSIANFSQYIGNDTITSGEYTNQVNIETSLVTQKDLIKPYILYNISSPTVKIQGRTCLSVISECSNSPTSKELSNTIK